MLNLDAGIKKAARIGIGGHVRPDGDCTGSCLATYNYIKTYFPEKEVTLFLEPIPNIFRFLSRAEEIQNDYPDIPALDLFIVQDCGDTGRLGAGVKYFAKAEHTICIDHHISNQDFAEENYVFPEASSTCELVFELIPRERITKEIAECLYTGMVHDTGVFQYSCTSAKTMNIAGILMEKGINYSKIIDDTFYTKTYAQNRILGQALLDSKLYLEGRCIVSMITADQMKEFGVLPKHLDGIVNQLRVTKGVEVAVFLYETEPGCFKFSVRANGDINLAELAMTFGGGGHAKAAGFSMYEAPESAIGKVVAEIKNRLMI